MNLKFSVNKIMAGFRNVVFKNTLFSLAILRSFDCFRFENKLFQVSIPIILPFMLSFAFSCSTFDEKIVEFYRFSVVLRTTVCHMVEPCNMDVVYDACCTAAAFLARKLPARRAMGKNYRKAE